MHTIGESAALGVAGLVLWGDMSYSQSAVSMAPRSTRGTGQQEVAWDVRDGHISCAHHGELARSLLLGTGSH